MLLHEESDGVYSDDKGNCISIHTQEKPSRINCVSLTPVKPFASDFSLAFKYSQQPPVWCLKLSKWQTFCHYAFWAYSKDMRLNLNACMFVPQEMQFYELYKTMVNKVTFVGFSGG